MDKVRVLHCIDSVGSDAGTELQLSELIRRFDKDRFELHLCCFEDTPRMRELAPHSTPLVLPLVSVYRPNGVRQILRLRRYINDRRIDIVHTFMIKANIVGVLAAMKSKCKAIVCSRRNLGYCMTPLYIRFFRFLSRRATRLLSNSECAKRFVIESERVPPEKVDVLYNGVDMTKFSISQGDPTVPRSLGIPDDAKVVGIVANLRPIKDIPLFLGAAKIVAEKVPEAAFVIVGVGELRETLGSLATELGIAEKVFFSDGKGRVPDYLRRMAVGCLSSESESFSNAILEYMAAGLPVVATDVGGNAEAIEDGLNGYLVRSRNPADFARPIIELLADDPRRAAMGRRSLERCREMFDIAASVRKHEEYYLALLEGARR